MIARRIYPLHVTCDTSMSLFSGISLMRAEHDPLPKTRVSVSDGFKATDKSPKSSKAFSQLYIEYATCVQRNNLYEKLNIILIYRNYNVPILIYKVRK